MDPERLMEFGFRTGTVTLYWVRKGEAVESRACGDETAPPNEAVVARVGNNLDVWDGARKPATIVESGPLVDRQSTLRRRDVGKPGSWQLAIFAHSGAGVF
jgi:hypothetical protein